MAHRPSSRWNQNDIDIMVEMYEDGANVTSISKKFGVHTTGVRRRLLRRGIKADTYFTNHLTEEQKLDILFRHQILLQSPETIASDYGFTGKGVRNLLIREGWYRSTRSFPAGKTAIYGTEERHSGHWRNSIKWKRVRERAKRRDGHACRICGGDVELWVHHIFRASMYPQYRYHLGKVITLCRKCHDTTINREGELIDYFLGMLERPSDDSQSVVIT